MGSLPTRLSGFSPHSNQSLSQSRLNPDPYPDWLRSRFPDWPWNARHLVEIQETLDAFTRGEIRNLAVFMPPRHMKSESVTVRYSAWRLEADPALRVIVAAYNQTLADKFSRKIRRIVREHGLDLSEERQAVHDWETTAGGGVRAVGVGAGITGQGGQLIVIDDPVKSRREADSATYREHVWDWYTDDLYTRREPGAQMILIQTRWHDDDLAGRILSGDDAPNWHVLNLPAILEFPTEGDWREPGEALWPEQFPIPVLESIRAGTSDRTWYALYQQSPRPASGSIFERDWWDDRNRYESAALRPVAARWLSWDTAMVANEDAAYTACVVVEIGHDRKLSVREVYRERLTFPQLTRAIEAQAERWNRDGKLRQVVIEDQSSGTSAIQTLRASAAPWLRGKITGWKPRGSKEERATRAAVWCRNGMVLLPEPGADVPWLLDFESELLRFPQSAFRDQVDAFSQAVIYLENWIKAGYTPDSVADAAD